MSSLSQIIGSTGGVAYVASVDSSGQLNSADSAAHTKLDTINSTLGGNLAVSGDFYPMTQPVSGEFFLATQPVSGSVSVSGTTAVSGDFYPGIQPVSAMSLPLPSGAASDANQATANGHLQTLAGAVNMGVMNVSSSAPVIYTTNNVLKSVVVVADAIVEVTDSVDLDSVKKCVVFGSHTDFSGIKVEVSADDMNWYKNTEISIWVDDGNFHHTIETESRYIRFSYENMSGMDQTWTCNLSYKN